MEIGNGSSYIKLPIEISRKHACINIKNSDEACFYWSVVCGLFPSSNNKQLTSSYPYYRSVLDTKNLPIPMPLNQIQNFEKLNNISINVYGLELNVANNKQFYTVAPVRLTKQKLDKHVNLLIVQSKYYPKVDDYDFEQPAELQDQIDQSSIIIAILATCLDLYPRSSVNIKLRNLFVIGV